MSQAQTTARNGPLPAQTAQHPMPKAAADRKESLRPSTAR